MSAWPTRRMGDIAPVVRRPVYVKPDEVYREIGVRSFGKGIFHKVPVTGLELGDKRVFWISPGDLVFNIVFAWEGAVALADASEEGMIGSHRFLTCVVDGRVADARFLKWWFAHPMGREQLLRASPGGAGRNRTLGIEKLGAIEVPLPPLDEQRRLVERIEHAATKTNECAALVTSIDEEVEALLAADANALFDSAFMRQWPVSAVGDIADVRAGVTLGRTMSGTTISVPYLRVANVQDGHIDLREIKKVEIYPNELDKWQLLPGDLLLTEGGDWDKLGRGALWHGQVPGCIHQNHVFRLRLVRQECTPEFLEYYIRSPMGRRYFHSAAKKTTNLASINQRQLKAFTLHLPPLHEQRRIVSEFGALRAKISSAKALQAERAKALDALLPAILDRAFKGEL